MLAEAKLKVSRGSFADDIVVAKVLGTSAWIILLWLIIGDIQLDNVVVVAASCASVWIMLLWPTAAQISGTSPWIMLPWLKFRVR